VDVVFTILPSPDHDDHMSPDLLDIFHVSSSGTLPSHSPKCHDWPLIDSHVMLEENKVDYSKTLGTFRGYDPSLVPYHLYLKHLQ